MKASARLVTVFVILTGSLGSTTSRADAAPRARCGCATARLLSRSADLNAGAAAWLHDGATVGLFAQTDGGPNLTPVPDLLGEESFAVESLGSSRLVRVRAEGAVPAQVVVGLVRRGEKAARDVATVKSGVPADGPPLVRALWLAPLELRDRPGCGQSLTHRLAWELEATSPPIIAFVVKNKSSGQSAVIDARHVGAFGIGRVDICDHGLPLQSTAVELEVQAVSASFATTQAWGFLSDGAGQADPTRTATPAGADRDLVAQPFPVPGDPTVAALGLKSAGVVVMAMVGGGAALFALFFWVILPRAKRRLVDVRCPACQARIPLDVLDKKTDGFFCPSCGRSGVWKGNRLDVDVTRL